MYIYIYTVSLTIYNNPVPLDKIEYVDHPELKINKNESTQMPFRYVKRKDGSPFMPEVGLILIKYSNNGRSKAVLMESANINGFCFFFLGYD